MTLHSVSGTRLRAEQLSDDSSVLEGPLTGYHHETYVLDLRDRGQIVKFREPRDQILWFDRRCFVSEEELLRALKGHITRIPRVHDVAGMGMQEFIPGHTLRAQPWLGRRVSGRAFRQILQLFGEMARITPGMLSEEHVKRRCVSDDRPEDGDTDFFLERLIVFIEEQVYRKNFAQFSGLFEDLGIRDESFSHLKKHVAGLKRRPFCLLHGDLHRRNLVVDPQGDLWAIDWELAMLGDPLYDLATHIYLMNLPKGQERRMAREWRGVVDGVRDGSSFGMEDDLPLIIDFKRAQSVFTDVIRLAFTLSGEVTDLDRTVPPGVIRNLQSTLAGAGGALGLTEVPSQEQIMAALIRWYGAQKSVGADRGEPAQVADCS